MHSRTGRIRQPADLYLLIVRGIPPLTATRRPGPPPQASAVVSCCVAFKHSGRQPFHSGRSVLWSSHYYAGGPAACTVRSSQCCQTGLANISYRPSGPEEFQTEGKEFL